MFFRCWTRSKADKLVNFRKANMWYLQDDIAKILESLGSKSIATEFDFDSFTKEFFNELTHNKTVDDLGFPSHVYEKVCLLPKKHVSPFF